MTFHAFEAPNQIFFKGLIWRVQCAGAADENVIFVFDGLVFQNIICQRPQAAFDAVAFYCGFIGFFGNGNAVTHAAFASAFIGLNDKIFGNPFFAAFV